MPEVIRDATVALAGAKSEIVSAEQYGKQAQRAVFIATNLNASGGDDLFLSIGQEAAANKGIRIAPGQTFTMSMDAGYKPSNKQIYGYAAGATNIAVHEEIFVRSDA